VFEIARQIAVFGYNLNIPEVLTALWCWQ